MMDRDYRNRNVDTEDRRIDDVATEQSASVEADVSSFIPRDRARTLLNDILTERAEVFRKLAQ